MIQYALSRSALGAIAETAFQPFVTPLSGVVASCTDRAHSLLLNKVFKCLASSAPLCLVFRNSALLWCRPSGSTNSQDRPKLPSASLHSLVVISIKLYVLILVVSIRVCSHGSVLLQLNQHQLPLVVAKPSLYPSSSSSNHGLAPEPYHHHHQLQQQGLEEEVTPQQLPQLMV